MLMRHMVIGFAFIAAAALLAVLIRTPAAAPFAALILVALFVTLIWISGVSLRRIGIVAVVQIPATLALFWAFTAIENQIVVLLLFAAYVLASALIANWYVAYGRLPFR